MVAFLEAVNKTAKIIWKGCSRKINMKCKNFDIPAYVPVLLQYRYSPPLKLGGTKVTEYYCGNSSSASIHLVPRYTIFIKFMHLNAWHVRSSHTCCHLTKWKCCSCYSWCPVQSWLATPTTSPSSTDGITSVNILRIWYAIREGVKSKKKILSRKLVPQEKFRAHQLCK